MASLHIDRLLEACIKMGGSDIHIVVGRPPVLRLSGRLRSLETKVLEPDDTVALMKSITPEKNQQELQEVGSTDFGFAFGDAGRFRTAVFRQKGYISMVLRLIPSALLSFEQIGLPKICAALCRRPRGLFLVTGPTGSGKTTTLASMINYINESMDHHIVTIEEPIEYYHNHKKSVINQREVGLDTPSFAEALRRSLRQDPDIVLVGEMRDRETLTAAMRAAETGHLVFGTLHANNAAQTIQRILDLFPQEERELARSTFALTIRAIISQQLLPGIRPDVTRVPAVEVLIRTPIVRKLISDERESDIPTAIRAGSGEGMIDYTSSLCKLVEEEYIDLKVAMDYAPNVEELKMAMKGIRTTSSGIL